MPLVRRFPWLNLSPGPVAALGEGQEPESASGETRGRGGLGAPQGVTMDLKKISPFKDFFEPIGQFIVAFSMLETQLNGTIRILMGISPRDLVKKYNTVHLRIEFFESVLHEKLKDPDALAWANDIIEDLRRANAHRNCIIHGPWNDFAPLTGKATKLEYGKSKSYGYTTPQILEIASKVFSIMTRMGFLTGHASRPDMMLGRSPGTCMPSPP
jgi:hypothetical protein